ncbi:glycosyltransferase [Flavobacterium petrolei]|uniref:Glycosyltransferase n=1 Tax=Flavobacterium petrolei TaxID=2259594 RepID=A0A482TIF0_9FLAO|nr:glycosyltransferase [Flavobacterium petrolei]RYJ50897.1 glycosyltransferase [Flavobacterium petrolei]
MRIIQLIDSLEPGGAERMAVHYANALTKYVAFSGLVATRKEGSLCSQIDAKVSYLYLNKKKTIDFKALYALRNYVLQHNVTVVHAHGTSFFLGFLLKLTLPSLKLIWHDHYGTRVNESIWNNLILIFCSRFFSCVFVVNPHLEIWCNKNLLTKKIYFIPNFATFENDILKKTFLKGQDKKRIVCLANLKEPKNHLIILKVFAKMRLNELGWTVHLIGKDYHDSYSIILKNFIHKSKLEQFIFIYDSKNDIKHILSQATIGILASTAEGFPVTLLEYGLSQLPVISTNVGYCPLIIKDNFSGLLFNPLDSSDLHTQFQKMISGHSLRFSFALHLQELVIENYSKEKVVNILISHYKNVIN